MLGHLLRHGAAEGHAPPPDGLPIDVPRDVHAQHVSGAPKQQKAPLGPGDAHDRVEDLLENLAEDEARVQRLDQGEQQLLLLDPGELVDPVRGPGV